MFDYERLEALSIEGEAPQSEPERQYYFMKKCRQWAEEEKERIGHPLTMSIQTLGCQMNAKDSEKMTAILEYIGYKEVEEPVADFVLYNTCTVRENANLKIYGRLGYLKNHKKKNPSMKIALCGCMMQEADEVERIRKSYSFVDLDIDEVEEQEEEKEPAGSEETSEDQNEKEEDDFEVFDL